MTAAKRRVIRPKLERTAPIRDFSMLFRGAGVPSPGDAFHDDAWHGDASHGDAFHDDASHGDASHDDVSHGNASRPDPTHDGGRSFNGRPGRVPLDVLDQSVKLGYSVIQEQIRQGRLVAQQMSRFSGDAHPTAGTDMNDLFRRMLHFSTDFGALLADLTETVMRTSRVNGNGRDAGAPPDPRAESDAAVGPNGPARLSVEIEARGRAKVLLDLGGAAASGGRLRVPGLYSLDGTGPPLTDVSVEPHSVRIRVPDDQPPGTYAGVIVDKETQEPKGTLSIRLYA